MGIKEFQGGSPGTGMNSELLLLSPSSSSECGTNGLTISDNTKLSRSGIMSDIHDGFHQFKGGIEGKFIREKLKTQKGKKGGGGGGGDGDSGLGAGHRGPLIGRHPSLLQLDKTNNNNNSGGGSVGSETVGEPLGSSSKEVNKCTSFRIRASRTPSPSNLKSDPLLSSTEKVTLQRSHSNVGPQRRRSPSNPRSRPASPGSIRGPSPAGSLDNLYIETVLKRVEKAQKARLYLLQQLGPHSFVVGGDSPEHKFKIMIGPQTCTCGRGPHCIHILFVMLRVFQISERDPRLWTKQLKNFEVESLVSRYEEQRRLRIKAQTSQKAKKFDQDGDDDNDTKAITNVDVCETEEVKEISEKRPSLANNHDELEKCVICLLEMVDCESLVDCIEGCHNKYHFHCVTIWAEYCSRQAIQLSCPLCRIQWDAVPASKAVVPLLKSTPAINQNAKLSSESNVTHEKQHVIDPSLDVSVVVADTCTSTPLLSTESFSLCPVESATKLSNFVQQSGYIRTSAQSHVRGCVSQAWPPHTFVRSGHAIHNPSYIVLPRCHSVVPKEFGHVAPAWAEGFGTDLVACLFSRDWKVKVLALQKLSQVIAEELSLSSSSSSSTMGGSDVDTVVKHCCQILTMMATNPVYKVYLACLQCLKTLLAYVSIKNEQNLMAMQELLKPVILTILLRCCDGTKPGDLSVATLVKLCKGQNGEYAVGRHAPYSSECGIGGVGYILKCLFDGMNDKESFRSWQWLLGRLNVLEKIMIEFPQDFHLVLVVPRCSSSDLNDSGSHESSMMPIASRYDRLVTIWRFALVALNVQHTNVVKQAREVFLTAVRFAATVPSVLRDMFTLAVTDPILEQRMTAWVRDELQGYLQNLSFTSESSPKQQQQFPITVRSSSSSNLGQMCSRRRSLLYQPHNVGNLQGNSNARCDTKSYVGQPHLPSCGGISPTKGLDQNYIAGKLMAFVSGGGGGVGGGGGGGVGGTSGGSSSNCVSNGTSPCPSSTASPSAIRRRLPGWNGSCNTSSRSNQQQQPPVKTEPTARSTARSVNQGFSKRPNYLPLQGTFRDVLEWEKLNRSSSPSRSSTKHRSPPPRIDRRQKCDKDANGDQGGNFVRNGQYSSSYRRSVSSSGVANLVNGGGRNVRVCSCEREIVTPTIKSQKKLSDVKQNSRLCSKKLDSILGPILPSLPNQGKGPPLLKTTPVHRRDSLPSVVPFSPNSQPPPVPPSSPEGVSVLLDNNLCKLKRDVELEEAVALATAIENSTHQVEIVDVPGLMQYDDEQELVIHEEPDDVDEKPGKIVASSCAYVENVHWKKGPILGTGAFSTCYQARDVQTGTLMAMKQVSFCRNSPDEQDKVMGSIKEEVTLMARLNHPHIVRILGATRQRNHFNMFVEWMPGGSVSNLLDKYGAFTEPVIINYTQQVLSGLAYLHDNQVLHRDLKGANLLVDSTGHYLRIGDFGAAARLASRSTVAGEFQGQLLGTIAFMAPEVLRGDDYGRSCDIWSVGCVLIEMATTKPPWNANDVSNHLALIYKIARSQEPPPIPDRLSPAARDLALRCLEVKSDDRPPAKELLKHPVFRLSFT